MLGRYRAFVRFPHQYRYKRIKDYRDRFVRPNVDQKCRRRFPIFQRACGDGKSSSTNDTDVRPVETMHVVYGDGGKINGLTFISLNRTIRHRSISSHMPTVQPQMMSVDS